MNVLYRENKVIILAIFQVLLNEEPSTKCRSFSYKNVYFPYQPGQ